VAVLIGALAVASAPAAHARPARPQKAARLPAYGTLWITATFLGSISRYAPPTANISQTAVATISGSNTTLDDPNGLAIDHQGRLWVANSSANSIVVFAANANGNATPVITIAGSKTGLNQPIAVALTQRGDVWVANDGVNTIVEFSAGAQGNVAPIRTIAGSNTALSDLSGIAVSPEGTRVWVSEYRSRSQTPSLNEYAGSAHGDAKPLVQISGPDTKLNDPNGITVGVDGNDPTTVNYVAGSSGLLRFAPGARGDAKPTVVSGFNTGIELPVLQALDAVGDIWVPSAENSEVARFGPTAHGNAVPERLFLDRTSNPGSIAVFMAPPSAPRAVHAKATTKKLHLTWSTPKVKGGGILGYQVRDRKKSGHWKVVKTTTKPSYTKSHPHKGFSYDVIAFNEAGYSTASSSIRP